MPRPTRLSVCPSGWACLVTVALLCVSTHLSAQTTDAPQAQTGAPAAADSGAERASASVHATATPRPRGTSGRLDRRRGLSRAEVADRLAALPAADDYHRPRWPRIEAALREPSVLRWTAPTIIFRADFTPSIAPSPVFDPGTLLENLERTADRMSRMFQLVGPRPGGPFAPDASSEGDTPAPDPLRALLVPGWSNGPSAELRLEF